MNISSKKENRNAMSNLGAKTMELESIDSFFLKAQDEHQIK